MPKYLMLMRHGHAARAGPIAPQEQILSETGKKETEEIATTLVDILRELPDSRKICIRKIWCGNHRQTTGTAEIMQKALSGQKRLNGQKLLETETLFMNGMLDPEDFGSYGNDGDRKSHRTVIACLKKKLKTLSEAYNAILVVGHKPLIRLFQYLLVGIAPWSIWCQGRRGDRGHGPRQHR